MYKHLLDNRLLACHFESCQAFLGVNGTWVGVFCLEKIITRFSGQCTFHVSHLWKIIGKTCKGSGAHKQMPSL